MLATNYKTHMVQQNNHQLGKLYNSKNMKVFILSALLCCALVAHAHPQGSAKIIGGEEAKLGQFPYIVSLQDATSKSNICGGALLSDTLVLSAANCLAGRDQPEDTLVYVGSNDLGGEGTTLTVKRIVVNEDYDQDSITNDIALLQLAEPAPLGPNVATINLPEADSDVAEDTRVIALGWGSTKYPNEKLPEVLNYIESKVVGQKKCQSAWGDLSDIIDSKVCVGGKKGEGLCFGDSGSPIVSGDTAIGIVSYGQPCAVGAPDVATKVSAFIPWIEKTSAALKALDQE